MVITREYGQFIQASDQSETILTEIQRADNGPAALAADLKTSIARVVRCACRN
jgi:hypothetical protein